MTEAAVAPVEDDDAELALAPPVDDVPVIECDPDKEVKPFRLAYRRQGKRIEETFHIRLQAPFAIFRRLDDVQLASRTNIPAQINAAVRGLFVVAMPEKDAARLLDLIEGDAEQVGVVPAESIGSVVDLIRALYYGASPVPTRPGSRNGPQRTGRTSSAVKSAKPSRSTGSRRKKG